jgi:murein DD-endopeptidase MepM/ murein hydrolase activator NlpD
VQDNGEYIAFFPYPHKLPPSEYKPQLTAEDMAGNITTAGFPFSAVDRTFRSDRINLNDSFLATKSLEFLNEVPGDMSPLERYLIVNSDVRVQNEAMLITIAKDTASEMLWEGNFIQMPSSASRAGFADHRTFYYNNTAVDEQTHMGLDLASVANAPIPAANSGRIVFADRLGIFGNMVVVDHGLGLQSLYSHMSEIHVEQGDMVKKGDILGRTGVTGLAGGDHLHFGITVGGIQVQPLEWLDGRWIRDNITNRLNP